MSLSELILENLESSVVVISTGMQIEFYNESFKRTIPNHMVEDLTGTDFLTLMYEQDRVRFADRVRYAAKGQLAVLVKIRLKHAELDSSWFSFSIKLIDDGQIQKYLLMGSFIENLSEKESLAIEHEEALIDSEELGHIGSWWVDVKTKKNHWSAGNFRLWGLDPLKPPPPVSDIIKKIHPEDAPEILAAIDRVGETGESASLTWRMFDSEGFTRYFLVRIRPWYVEGTITEVKGVNLEITDIITAQQELEDKLHEISLQHQKLTEYIHINSHEVRKPISNILGLVNILKSKTTSDHEILPLLDQEARHMDEIIKRINRILSKDGSQDW